MQKLGEDCEDGGESQETILKLGNTEQSSCSDTTSTETLPANSRLSNGAYDHDDDRSSVRVVGLQASLDKQVRQKPRQIH